MSQIDLPKGWETGKTSLLPIEEDKVIDGIQKKSKIQYLAECTAAKIETGKESGNQYIRVTWSIDNPTLGRVNVDDIFSLTAKALWRLGIITSMLGLNPEKLDTDDFLGKFMFIHIKHESFDSKQPDPTTGLPRKIWQEKVDTYIKRASADDVAMYVPSKQEVNDLPF